MQQPPSHASQYSGPIASANRRPPHIHAAAASGPVPLSAGIPVRPAPVGDVTVTAPISSPRHHPLVDSLIVALGNSSNTAAQATRPMTQEHRQKGISHHLLAPISSGSQSARGSTVPSQSLRSLPSHPASIQTSRSIRQSSAAMRRKFESLQHAQQPLSPAHAAALADCTTADGGGVVPDVLPSLLPASARVYTRPPLTNFVVSLNSMPSSSPNRQWEQLSFPSPIPPSDGTPANEAEVNRLSEWFEQAWITLEQNTQKAAAKEKKEQARKIAQQQAIERAQLNPNDSTDNNRNSNIAEEEKSLIASGSNTNASLSPSLLHNLDVNREKLIYIVFHELLRHITATCRRRGALLEKVWSLQHRISESKTSYRLSEIISLTDEYSKMQLEKITNQCNQLVRAEHAKAIRLGVDLTYSQSILDSKNRIISNLSEENDKDLLYSNQQVCIKEMELLKAERETIKLQSERQKEKEQLKYLEEDRINLEKQLIQTEIERDDANKITNFLQDLLDQKLKKQSTIATQYYIEDVPAEPSKEEQIKNHSVIQIQRIFRGFYIRKKLKQMGLLSRKFILKKLHTLQLAHSNAAARGIAASSSGINTNSNGNGTNNNNVIPPLPSIPRAFLSLMHPVDMALNRSHFIRIFSRKNLLKWIALLYVEKSFIDHSYIRNGQYKKEFSYFIYDFYLLRHGSRDSAEMDLLDLFASIEKHIESSPRVRLFSMLLNNSCRHRKIIIPQDPGGATNDHKTQEESQMNDSNTIGVASTTTNTNTSAASANTPSYHMSAIERDAHELKLRLTISLYGGRSLNARVLDFILRFNAASRKLGRGPFQSVSDNNDGITWIALDSMEELITRAWARLPAFMLRAVLAKIRHKADTMPGGLGGNQHQQQPPESQRNLVGLTATSSSHPPSASAVGSSNTVPSELSRFVDYDYLLEVLVESYIDEDARMHHTLIDIFSQQNPAADMRGQHRRGHSLVAPTHAPKRSVESVEGATLATAANTVSDASGSTATNTVLEPEMFAFPHFCDVLRALGISWNEDRLLRIYEQSIQRAIHRNVSIEDFVTTVRCYSIMPVDIDWNRLEMGEDVSDQLISSNSHPHLSIEEAAKRAMAQSGEGAVDVELPGFDNPSISSLSLDENELERRHAHLKNKLREMEATAHSKYDHAVRRHTKEMEFIKLQHQKEIESLQLMHTHQLELNKRALEMERTRAASDYNSLFQTSNQEFKNLQRMNENKESKQLAHNSASVAHFTQKLAEESRALELVQAKLASKSEKYAKKKTAFIALQQRCAKAEAALLTLVQAQQASQGQ
jgi:hypothetical protein